MDKLLPCPFCGGSADFAKVPNNDGTPNGGGEYVCCTQCGVATILMFPLKQEVKTQLAEIWNTRAVRVEVREVEPAAPDPRNEPALNGPYAKSGELAQELGMPPDQAKQFETRLEYLAGAKPTAVPQGKESAMVLADPASLAGTAPTTPDALADRLESYIPDGDGYNSEYAKTLSAAVAALRQSGAGMLPIGKVITFPMLEVRWTNIDVALQLPEGTDVFVALKEQRT